MERGKWKKEKGRRGVGEGKGFAGPMSNYFLYAPVSDCMGRPRMHTYLLERSYSTRTTMKRTNFPRRFDKPNLNFQKVYTHIAKAQVIFRNHNPRQNCLKLCFFQHSKKPAKYKNDSQTAKSHFVSVYESIAEILRTNE